VARRSKAVQSSRTEDKALPHDLHKALSHANSLLEQSRRSAHKRSRDRRKEGEAMRQEVPLASHAEYEAAPGRPDPVGLLQSQDDVRITSLVPIRFGRMAASPFCFYRGAAIVMADDLARTPTTGWLAQACGDAHLDNFGAFGTEQGTLVFDVNDFDETYPAPWEWDLKRLVASAVLAFREIGAGTTKSRRPATAAANCIVLVSGRWKIQGRQSSERESRRHSGQPPALAARGTQREASGWGVASQADAGEAKGSRREAPRDEGDGEAEGATAAPAAEAARHHGAGGAARRGRGGDRHQGRREGGRRGSTSTPPPVSGGHRLGPTPSSRPSWAQRRAGLEGLLLEGL